MANDGGPAFPALIPVEHSDEQGKDYPNYSESGMSLRDWFAGQALVAFGGKNTSWPEDGRVASRCYEMADAMLKAREQ